MRHVAGLCHFPVAVGGGVSVAETGVVGHAVLRQIGAAVCRAVDRKTGSFKDGDGRGDCLDRVEIAVVCAVVKLVVGRDQPQNIAACCVVQLDAVGIGDRGAAHDGVFVGTEECPVCILIDAQPEILPDIFPQPDIELKGIVRRVFAARHIGQLLAEDIAHMRVPDPHEVRLGAVRVAEVHSDIAFAVTVHVIKADGIKRALRIRVSSVVSAGSTVLPQPTSSRQAASSRQNSRAERRMRCFTAGLLFR